MNTKLDNITTQYRKFNANQALTEGQLNEFIDYFEDQDRLSRTRLAGVGIACGLKSSKTIADSPDPRRQSIVGAVDGNLDLNDFDAITITQGAGVTTDGDLITLRRKEDGTKEVAIDFQSESYTHYREYLDQAQYAHFFKKGAQMPLVELLTIEEFEASTAAGVSTKPIYPISNISNLNNRVIILYLESYSNEETPCEDADCDHQGAEQVSNLKVLLAEPQYVEDYMVNGDAQDSIYKRHNSYELLYNTLADIEARRVILNAGIITAAEVKKEFQDTIKAGTIVHDLSFGFAAIAGAFNVNLNLGVGATATTLENKLKSLLYTTASNIDDYQYRYDLLKDLIDTYNEIKGLVLHLKAECCPDITSFPKHLMLGAVGASLGLGDYTPYRHDFYNSPINTNDDENYERAFLLANRFVQKIQGFQSIIGPIKITPSRINARLGEKAIPYYYNVTHDLLEKWNFEKTQTDKETYNLSYHTANLANIDFVQHPLYYNIDDNDFYRIEGHLTLPYKVALQNINDLKAQYGLAFDVIALVLQKGTTTVATKASVSASALASAAEPTILSVKNLREQLLAISSDISNQIGNPQRTLQTISGLDKQLKLLNTEAFTGIVKENPKDDIISELLSEFLERKSGLEHLAGVEPRGTFVLLYQSEEENEVIADFALPYLCCSKKDPVFLVLPATELCENDAAIPMTIIPLDGEIKAFVNGTKITAIKQIGGQNFFDPVLVSNPYLGQPITFTVNDDPVDTQIVVHPQPDVTVTTGTISYSDDTTNLTATVIFNVSNAIAGLTYTWNFGDGKAIEIIPDVIPANGMVSKTHIYNLVAGQQDIYNPTLTVSNASNCSTKYNIAPLTLVGQATVTCLDGMQVIIQYNVNHLDKPGNTHTCNNATFNLKGNGIVIKPVYLNNAGGSTDSNNRPAGETTGPNRYNKITISRAEAEAIANAPSAAANGFITFSLDCALTGNANCHQGVAWTQILLDNEIIYDGFPSNNFLTINPCTGEVKK